MPEQGHTSADELGQIARRARPKLLVIYHSVLWDATPEAIVARVERSFSGPVVYARDLDTF